MISPVANRAAKPGFPARNEVFPAILLVELFQFSPSVLMKEDGIVAVAASNMSKHLHSRFAQSTGCEKSLGRSPAIRIIRSDFGLNTRVASTVSCILQVPVMPACGDRVAHVVPLLFQREEVKYEYNRNNRYRFGGRRRGKVPHAGS